MLSIVVGGAPGTLRQHYLGQLLCDANASLRRVGNVLDDVWADQWLLVHEDLRALPRVRSAMDGLIELFAAERAVLEGRTALRLSA